MKNANTTMYEVLESNEEKATVKLKDIETNEIIDFGLSKSITENCLIFTRILSTEEVNFTSGLLMIFSKNHKEYLARVLKKEIRKSSLDKQVQMFISYFHLARKQGTNIIYQ